MLFVRQCNMLACGMLGHSTWVPIVQQVPPPAETLQPPWDHAYQYCVAGAPAPALPLPLQPPPCVVSAPPPESLGLEPLRSHRLCGSHRVPLGGLQQLRVKAIVHRGRHADLTAARPSGQLLHLGQQPARGGGTGGGAGSERGARRRCRMG